MSVEVPSHPYRLHLLVVSLGWQPRIWLLAQTYMCSDNKVQTQDRVSYANPQTQDGVNHANSALHSLLTPSMIETQFTCTKTHIHAHMPSVLQRRHYISLVHQELDLGFKIY